MNVELTSVRNESAQAAGMASIRPDTLVMTRRADRSDVHATKRVRAEEPYMSAHFPSKIIMPGVFLIGLLERTVCDATLELEGVQTCLEELSSVRFLAPFHAGEEIVLDVSILRAGASRFQVTAAFSGDGSTLRAKMSGWART